MKCTRCGTELAPGVVTCPQCGAARPQLPRRFTQLEQRFVSLDNAYQSGRLDRQVYQAELDKLVLQDEFGVIWALSSEGRWYWYNDGWVRGDPPSLESTGSTITFPKTRGRWLWPTVGCGCLTLLLVVAAVATVAWLGYEEYKSSPMLVEEMSSGGDVSAGYTLSAVQQDLVKQQGYPESFAILFYQEESSDGSLEDIRYETWSYYSAGTEFTFLNGQLIDEGALNLEVSDLVPLTYQPEQFTLAMNLDEVIATAGLDRYLVIPVDEIMVEDAQVYFAEQLTFGLKEDELVFVETLALEVE
ncbi:MAG: zinc ribbon domain-containing protein [Chloroflexota bacterium]